MKQQSSFLLSLALCCLPWLAGMAMPCVCSGQEPVKTDPAIGAADTTQQAQDADRGRFLISPGNPSTALKDWRSFHQDDARMEDVWSVDNNGVLTCKGSPLGYLYTWQKYADFTLELEYRWPPNGQAGRGGILIRMTEPHKIWPRSLEAQINSPDAGDFWGLDGFALNGPKDRLNQTDHAQFGKLTNLKKTESVEKPVGQWNRYKVTAKGSTVTLEINGHRVNQATDCDTGSGHIVLTAEGNPIQFRNVRVTAQ